MSSNDFSNRSIPRRTPSVRLAINRNPLRNGIRDALTPLPPIATRAIPLELRRWLLKEAYLRLSAGDMGSSTALHPSRPDWQRHTSGAGLRRHLKQPVLEPNYTYQFERTLNKYHDRAFVGQTREIWYSLPREDRDLWHQKSSPLRTDLDIDTSNSVRRASTNPYAAPTPKASQRRTTRASPYDKDRSITPEHGSSLCVDRDSSPFPRSAPHLDAITPPLEPLPPASPRRRIPPSDPLGYAPYNVRGVDPSYRQVPAEYDEFEYQEPFLDVPIPFDTALPKGFNPLPPLVPVASAGQHSLSNNAFTLGDWGRSAMPSSGVTSAHNWARMVTAGV